MWRKIFFGLLIVTSSFCNPSERRIVGGQDVALGQLPYMASIRSWGSTVHFAGGVIIGNRWILSSGHFMSGFADNALNIVMGIVDLTATGISRRSEQIILHPRFSPNPRLNDIACVRMVTPALTFTPTLSVIHMDSNPVPNPDIGFIAGWGSASANMGPNSQMLQRLQVRVTHCFSPIKTNNDDIREIPTISTMEPTVTTTFWITTTTTMTPDPQSLCTQSLTFGGICTSDIGGPLVTLSGLVGIASWHPNPCGSRDDVFTPIREHRSWINTVTGI